MKTYKETITLNRNKRGCYILDTTKGCCGGRMHGNKGCYGDCYAKRIADRYGFDFNKTQKRDFDKDNDQIYLFNFEDEKHSNRIVNQIKNIDMPFVRIGEMGDPSEDWEHTLVVCKIIARAKKPIVIITKHWKTIPDKLLKDIEALKLCINTSVSALDNEVEVKNRLHEFYRLKNVCNSILRIISCDFNKENKEGDERSVLQDELFKHNKHLDTIFRPSPGNVFLKKGIIKAKKVKFLDSMVLASVRNSSTYFGKCDKCPDMCGVNTGLATP